MCRTQVLLVHPTSLLSFRIVNGYYRRERVARGKLRANLRSCIHALGDSVSRVADRVFIC